METNTKATKSFFVGFVVEGQTCCQAKDANSNLQPTIYVTIFVYE